MSISTLNSTLLAQRGTQSALLQLGTSVPDQPPNQSSRLTVVDGSLELLDGLETALTGERLLKIEPSQNPIQAISAYLKANPSSELHLVAHGAPGQIKIGTTISSLDLLAHSAELSDWNLDRIYLWSCNVGQDKSFVSILQELTGASVISSYGLLGKGEALKDSGFKKLEDYVLNLDFNLISGTSASESIDGTEGNDIIDGFFTFRSE